MQLIINNMTNLNERLPVINDTSMKMIYVVDNLCGRHLTLCILGRDGGLIDYKKQEG